MAKTRETPCKYYVCKGECKKGREKLIIMVIVSIVINTTQEQE